MNTYKYIKNGVWRAMMVLILAVISLSSGLVASATDYVAIGDSAYNKGDYTLAIASYRKVIESQGVSAPLLYNLGNAYYRNGKVGLAVASLYRAYRLDPSNSTIDNNLSYLESKVNDSNVAELHGRKGDVSPDTPTFFQSVWYAINVETPSNFWALYAAMAFVLLTIAVALYIFGRNVGVRKVGFFGGAILLFFSIIFLVFTFSSASDFANDNEGVVVAYKVSLYAEPKTDAKTVGTPLHEGTRMKILDQRVDAKGNVDWYRVRLNSSLSGWVAASDFIGINQNSNLFEK